MEIEKMADDFLESLPCKANMPYPEVEKAAIDGYHTLISEIEDKHVVKLLRRILEDEIIHFNILTALHKKYYPNKG